MSTLRRSGGIPFRRGSARVAVDGVAGNQEDGDVGRGRRDQPLEAERREERGLVIGPELAGHAVVVVAGEVGRPVARDMRPGIGAPGFMLGMASAVGWAVVVRRLGQQRGQDIDRDKPMPEQTQHPIPD